MQMAEKEFNELTLCWLAYKLQYYQDQGEKEKRMVKTRKKNEQILNTVSGS